MPNLYTIPAGVPFADALAAELLRRTDGRPEALSRMRILLPTRRACRVVRDAFLRLSGGKPLLLPRLQPLGDVDAEELSLDLAGTDSVTDILDLPPAIDPLQRQILLARLIMARDDYDQGPDHAIALAATLGMLLDSVYTENLSLDALPQLAAPEFADHWQKTVKFLTILSIHWPEILAERGVLDTADRRNRLINALADRWAAQPPAHPIIAAGSTGSIPATARLLGVIASLPQGAVVLPGLDQTLDDDSWAALDDTHPQATLRHLLATLQVPRAEVRLWPVTPSSSPREMLAAELMRPAATTAAWAALGADPARIKIMNESLQKLVRVDADTPQEEAQVIAIRMRHALETPGRTVALVTPDRALARRVAMACRRWGLEIDDSGGQKLSDTRIGGFLRLAMQACVFALTPAALLALLRHGLCGLGLDYSERTQAISLLEIELLRGPKPAAGMNGLRNRLADKIAAGKISPGPAAALTQFIDRLDGALSAFLTLAAQKDNVTGLEFLDAHIALAETLATRPGEAGADILWRGDDGEAAAQFLASLRDQAALLPPLDAEQYAAVLDQLMRGVTVRPVWGTHPRLSILGQLESRLLQADLVILGGLNEGSWPPDAGHDPWMSRPMRAAFGLPSPERFIGLAAHDFVQGFCARDVMLIRAKRVEGSPAVPARWLQRLDTVLQAAQLDPARLTDTGAMWLDMARNIDRSAQQKSYPRPAPTPPVALRPRKLPVTKIETWMHDPYGIYAQYVLRLHKLDPLEKQPDAADRGTFVHAVMDKFMADCPGAVPANARSILLDHGSTLINARADDPGFWDFWWPRFERLADWVVAHETDWRHRATPVRSEVKGAMTLPGPAGAFTLTARADRIDRLAGGAYAVIDYKSGGAYTGKKIQSGDLPQLPLEALILQAGGFTDLPAGAAGYLGYWLLTGGNPPGDVKATEDGIGDTVGEARQGLEDMIRLFDNPATPYFSVPHPDRAPRHNDYEQLARIQEWTALDDTAEETA